MGALRNNPLLAGTFVIAALYWIIGPHLPSQYLSGMLSLLLLVSGTLTLAQYTRSTFEIVWQKRRSDDDRGRGSHLAVYGVFLFAAGSVYAGAFGVVWNIAGQPADWLGTASSNFSRACHIAGFFFMQISPDVSREGLELRGRWWTILIGSAVLVGIGFWLGIQIKTFETSYGWLEYRLSTYAAAPSLILARELSLPIEDIPPIAFPPSSAAGG